MPEPSPPSPKWHKRVAVENNNRAWELATRRRTPEEDLEMLQAAHVSSWHWSQIGTELHRHRAGMLLAEVHALLGHGPLAFRLADSMRTYFLGQPDTPDWEIAFTHAIHAHAAHAAGRFETHRTSHRAARQAIDALQNEEDRQIVLQTFQFVPGE